MAWSQEQRSRIFPMDLTTSKPLRMMWKSSVRRRRDPTRDVLRTSVPADGQPSQRVGWGATARAGGGPPVAVADPVGPRAGHPRDSRHQCLGRCFSSLDRRPPIVRLSLLIRDPERMMDHDIWFGWTKSNLCAFESAIKGGGAKTSREPNGRTREEGSDRSHPPAARPSELRRDACSTRAGAQGPCGVRGVT
jgi:hypothetical protein